MSINQNVLGLIFASINDSAVIDLTKLRTMGSIPYGGRYRMVDFPLSNMVNPASPKSALSPSPTTAPCWIIWVPAVNGIWLGKRAVCTCCRRSVRSAAVPIRVVWKH